MKGQPILRISPSDLDHLLTTLEVSFVKLTECLVSPGWRLCLAPTDAPGIHYNLGGAGKMIVGDQPPIDLLPHTLVIVPPRHPFRIEVASDQQMISTLKSVDGNLQTFTPGALRRFVAGDGEPKIMLICGYFRASYGASIELFSALPSAIVEQFDPDDHVDRKLKSGLAELIAQEVGMGAMTTALLKQVLIALLRRSLSSNRLWVERFSMLSDPQISRAFADMVARPDSSHSVHSLAQTACLSRSAFMARFTEIFGRPPMIALRELRVRQAAILLSSSTNNLTIDQIARSVGYASRGSFLRAFQKVYGSNPSEYRAAARQIPRLAPKQ